MNATETDTIAVALARIEVSLDDIKRRLQEMAERSDAHAKAIQAQEIRCEGCRRDIEGCQDTSKTLYARITRLEERQEVHGSQLAQAKGEARGIARTWAAVTVILTLVISAAAVWVARH